MPNKTTPKSLYVGKYHPPEFYVSLQSRYREGGEVYRMLENLLGEDVFKKEVALYLSRHGECTNVKDFIRCLSDASGKDLSQFLYWLDHEATPNLDVTDKYDPNTHIYTLRFEQHSRSGFRYFHKMPMLIPVKMGLVNDHDDVPITFSLHDSKEEQKETVLVVKNRVQEFQFKIEGTSGKKPIPSLLRGFSAPVKLNYAYTQEELRCLAMHDADIFNRWDAYNKYIKPTLLKLIEQYQKTKTLPDFPVELLQLFQKTLATQARESDVLSFMMALPTPNELADEMAVIDIDAIFAVYDWVTTTIAEKLKDQFLSVYHRESSAAEHSLRNTALYYLMRIKSPDPALAMRQFDESLSVNMVDTLAALRVLCDVECKESEMAKRKFFDTFQDDYDAINNWFSAQAASQSQETLAQVKKLVSHPKFKSYNAGHVSALLVTWSRNLRSFHHASGEGYAFLADCISKEGYDLTNAFKKCI